MSERGGREHGGKCVSALLGLAKFGRNHARCIAEMDSVEACGRGGSECGAREAIAQRVWDWAFKGIEDCKGEVDGPA